MPPGSSSWCRCPDSTGADCTSGAARSEFRGWRPFDRDLCTATGNFLMLLADAEKDFTMRGPGNRLNHEVRRSWRCPRCQARLFLPGTVTSVECSQCPDGTIMQLTSEYVPSRFALPLEGQIPDSPGPPNSSATGVPKRTELVSAEPKNSDSATEADIRSSTQDAEHVTPPGGESPAVAPSDPDGGSD